MTEIEMIMYGIVFFGIGYIIGKFQQKFVDYKVLRYARRK